MAIRSALAADQAAELVGPGGSGAGLIEADGTLGDQRGRGPSPGSACRTGRRSGAGNRSELFCLPGIRLATAGVLTMISWAITRPNAWPLGSLRRQRVLGKDRREAAAELDPYLGLLLEGNTSTIRSTVWAAELVWSVAKTR